MYSHLGNDGYAQPKRPRPTHDWEKIIKFAPNKEKTVVTLDNRWVVPYNGYILLATGCHTNLEITHHINCVKYVYKYVFKGDSMVLIRYKVNKEGKRRFNFIIDLIRL